MSYIDIETGVVITHAELAARHPTVCMPAVPDLPWLAAQGLAPLREPPIPADEPPPGHDYVQQAPSPCSDGWWAADWAAVPWSHERLYRHVVERINTWRSEQECTGFWWNGKLWDSDPVSVQRITSIGAAGLPPPGGYWTDANNQDVPLDADGMRALYLAMLQRGGEIHDRQRAMKLALATLTVAELLVFQPRWADETPNQVQEATW